MYSISWQIQVIIASILVLLYYLLPSRNTHYKPDTSGAVTLALGVFGAIGACNLFFGLLYLQSCACFLDNKQKFELDKQAVFIGCLVVFILSITEVTKKFLEKLILRDSNKYF